MGVVISGRRRPVRPDSIHVERGRRTRRRILDAARIRILREGYDALRLDALAADVGVTKAAVVKSVGGKASILLELGDEDRQDRLQVIRAALTARTGVRRRLADTLRGMLERDAARLNVVMAYIGYMWFWMDADHDRAQAMVTETRELLCDLLIAASPKPLSTAEARILSQRFLGGYVIGLRDLRYGYATLDKSVRFVVNYVLEATAAASPTRI